jgi:hypothetical protein
MTVQKITNSLIYLLSSDTKPTNFADNTIAYEQDTGSIFRSVSGVWSLFRGASKTETLTNKTLTAPVISSISNTGTLTLPTTTDTLVGRVTTDTLTGKTIVLASNTVTDTSAAQGDIQVHNGTRFVRLGKGSTNQVLQSGPITVAWATFNAENCGIATGTANGSTTVFNVAHSLGSVPSNAMIICSSHVNTFTYTTDSTNIIVTFTTAPSSGTVVFNWRCVG